MKYKPRMSYFQKIREKKWKKISILNYINLKKSIKMKKKTHTFLAKHDLRIMTL